MNEEKHWNGIGSGYNDEIFDVFKSDRRNRLSYFFRKHSNTVKTAIDFGCGTGKSFRFLAPAFKSILALDISEELLAQAASTKHKNIQFRHADLTNPRLRLPKADFGFCCNVVMLTKPEQNDRMFRNIRKSLKNGGTALFVIPSFESALLSANRLIDWYGREGVRPSEIAEDELAYFRGNKRDVIQGLIQIDGVVTKHYTEPELHLLMEKAGFRITALEHLEYEWDTEFSSPPKWMKAPYPWDWVMEVACR